LRATPMDTIVERIADWSSSLRFEDIPQRVVSKAKLQILSVMAAVYAGYSTRAARAIREIIMSTRANGRSVVFPSGESTSPTVAVVANAAASMALDYDDYLFLGHSGHSAVLAGLGFAQESGLGGKDLLLSQIIANEVGGRLGASVVLGPQNGQLWTHLHAPAAASAAARLMNLDAVQTAHAIAISLYQPPFAMWPGFMGPDSKLLSAAFPARDGILCARAASWNLTGPLDILDSDLGFGEHFSHYFLKGMFTGFGRSWVSDTLSFKIYPGCAYLGSALEALFDAVQKFEQQHHRPLEPADVVAMTVRTNLFGSEMNRLGSTPGGDRTSRLAPVRINFSLPHSLAVGLISKRLTPYELKEDEIAARRDEILALAGKIEVVHDWKQTLAVLENISKHLPLRELLGEIDLKKLLAVRNEAGRQLGGSLVPGPKDLLRIGAFLLAHVPDVAREISRAAAGSIEHLIGDHDSAQTFDLADADLENMPMPFGTEIIIRLSGNHEIVSSIDIPSGAAGRDAAETKGLVRKKFRDLATPLLGEQKVGRAIELVDELEKEDNLAALTQNLCAG